MLSLYRIMTVRNRKLKNDTEKEEKEKDGEKTEKDPSQTVKPPDKTTTWSFFGIVQNVLKVSFLIFIVPVFLNYTALIKEERELKPEGNTLFC